MRRRVVVVGLLVFLAGISAASAASLTVNGPTVSVADAAHPCPGGATAQVASDEVQLTLASDECSGDQVELTLLDEDGHVVDVASGVVDGDAVQLVLSTDGATGAVAVVHGWDLPVSWSAPPAADGPIYPANADTELADVDWRLRNSTQACVDLTVTTQSTTPVAWALTVDLSQAPFNGASAWALSLQGLGGWRYVITEDVPEPGFAQISGRPWSGRDTIVAGQEYSMRVCSWGLPPGVDTPSAYTVSFTEGPAWDSRRACVTTTVAGNGTSEFYVGWSADVDMSAAVAVLTDAGNTVDGWTFQPNDARFDTAQTSPTTFHATSTWRSDIVGDDDFSFTICAVDY